MAVRQDKVQISIAFLTDESKEYARLVNENKQFINDLRTAQKEGKDLGDVVRKVAASGAQIGKIDLGKLAPTQLIDRARQLQQVIQLIPQSEPEYAQLSAELKTINDRLATLRVNAKGVADGVKTVPAAIDRQTGAFSGLVSAASRAGVIIGGVYATIASIGGVVNATRETEKLFAVLKNALGGGENRALAVFAELQEFAATTPFALNEVVGAFTKLQQRNFNPTIEQLRTMGDIAATSGKSIDQFVEAILDAQTGEFERLKEFGVVAKKQGDDVNVTFRGQSETFKNTSENLNAYLLKLGQLPGIQGATAAVAATLDGSLSNLGDNFTRLFATIGSGGGILKGIVDAFGGLVAKVNEYLSVPVSAKLEEEKSAFGGLSVQILNANVGSKTRTELIEKLRQQYPDYLKGIDAEKATNEQLKPILDKINQSYIVRIALQKQQEKIQPLLEAEAEVAGRLAEKRVQYNRDVAKGAELAGVNLASFETEAERVAAVQQRLQEKVRLQGSNFSFTATEEAKLLSRIKGTASITAEISLQEKLQEKTKEAERQRLEIVNELRKSYGSLVDEVQSASTAPATATGGAGQAEKDEAAAKAITERRKKQIEADLAGVESAALRREVVLLRSRNKGEIDEERYQDGLLAIQERKYREQLEVYRRFRKDQTDEALKVQKQLLEIEQRTAVRTSFVQEIAPLAQRIPAAPVSTEDDTKKRLDRQDIGEEALQTALNNKFRQALLTEQDYDLKRLELKRLSLAEEIAILRDSSIPQVEEVRKREEEKAKVEAEIDQKRIQNQERSEALRQQVQQAGFQATSDLFSLAADLLAQDEAARKKNASAIKAFQSAEVLVQGIAEVQRIWAGVASLGPIAGPILGAIQTGIAVGRTSLALSRIASTKFARGIMKTWDWSPASMGIFGGKPHSGGGTKGYFEDGTHVEVEKDEAFVVVNKQNTPLLRALSLVNSHGGNGIPFFRHGGVLKFEGGGVPSLNTTPVAIPSVGGAEASGIEQMQQFGAILNRFERIVADFPREVRSRVVYTDIEAAGDVLNAVREDAAV